MNKAPFRKCGAMLKDAARDIAAMPWPTLLVYCIALAIVLTLLVSILPLALFLFAAFMAIKLVIVTFVVHTRRGRREPYEL
ncbi:MAG: hypothetical protein EOO78_16470 [Oxalobacteraceae bacterium]|nr:MAG: hypothetical protein EOO78_16470 [Oxalobacteraceae bacterium]